MTTDNAALARTILPGLDEGYGGGGSSLDRLAPLAHSGEMLHDPYPVNDNEEGESAGSLERETGDIAAYHRVGRTLTERAAREGRKAAAAAAAEVFREALAQSPTVPSLHNGLGVALVEIARTETGKVSSDALTEAVNEFRIASESVDQHASRAAYLRYRINLATTILIRAEQSGDRTQLSEALEALQSISDLPESSPYWPHVQDNMANALAALGRVSEAIPLYDNAISRWQNRRDKARSFNNLGLAYAEMHRYLEARQSHVAAMALQRPDQEPLTWGRTQYNLGSALLREVLEGKQPPEVEKLLVEAIQAFEAARNAHKHLQASEDWVAVTMGLANAQVCYGICLLDSPEGRQTEVRGIRHAISLYKEIIPRLVTSQLRVGFGNLQIGLQILARVSDDKASLRGHVIDAIVLRIRHDDRSLRGVFSYESGDFIRSLMEDLLSTDRTTNITGGGTDLLVSNILAILAASELPKTEWSEILRAAIDQISLPALRPRDKTERRRALDARGTPPGQAVTQAGPSSTKVQNGSITAHARTLAHRRELPALPAGLRWPTKDFDQSQEFGKRGGLVHYLDREWKGLIGKGRIDMPTLREHYPATAEAIHSYQRPNSRTGERRRLPSELTIPTLKEKNDRALRGDWVRSEDADRLSRARRRRQAKARQANL